MTPAHTGQSGFRHELKYLIAPGEAHLLARRLDALIERDPHAGPGGIYTVRSLYFDTWRDDALREKIEGMSRREKWRMRTYSHASIPPRQPMPARNSAFGTYASSNGADDRCTEARQLISLERKTKTDGLGRKLRARVSRKLAHDFAHGIFRAPAPEDPGALALFLATARARSLLPRTVIAYEREAFRYPAGNVRITIDANVRSSPHPDDFLDENALLAPVAGAATIVEVKYDAVLPAFIQAAIACHGIQRTAWSKYALGRRLE